MMLIEQLDVDGVTFINKRDLINLLTALDVEAIKLKPFIQLLQGTKLVK